MKLRSGRNPNAEEKPNQKKPSEEENTQSQARKPTETVPPPLSQPRVTDQETFDTTYKNLVYPGAYTKKLLRYLRQNQTHSLHRGVRSRFPRRKIVTHYPGQIAQSDLIDMQKFSGSNSGFNYILVFIDCFSKKLWTEPLKNKSGLETAAALRKILNRVDFPIQSVIVDEGLEYKNQHVLSLFQEYNIHSYHIKTKLKASSAERVNRTLKGIIWKHFSETNRKRWIDILDILTENYNKTFHSTIKMTPNEVTWENREKVFKTMFPKINSVVNCRLKKGDRVRIALNKEIFEKKYTQNWSKDIFTIISVFQKNGVCWYRLKDENENIYPKAKYFYELNQV